MSEPVPPFADAIRIWLDEKLAKLPNDNARFRHIAMTRNRWLVWFNEWQRDLRCGFDSQPAALERFFGPMTADRFHIALGTFDAAQDRLVKQTEPA